MFTDAERLCYSRSAMAGRIPQSFINDLLTRVDIVDVIESRMTLKKTGKNYSGPVSFS